jgi:predicted nucleic acid-binding protein
VAALEAAARGRFVLVVPDLVLAEVAYVLVSLGMDAHLLAEHLERILDLPGVEVADEVLTRDAIAVWAEGKLDFADAYLAALARRVRDSGVLSFDRDLDSVPGVGRVDPASAG